RSSAVRNFRFDELREHSQRFLPSEVAHLSWNHSGNSFLSDRKLGSAEDFLQSDRDAHLAGEIGIVELVGVTEQFVRLQFDVLATEGMALAGREVRKRHVVAAPNSRVDFMNF